MIGLVLLPRGLHTRISGLLLYSCFTRLLPLRLIRQPVFASLLLLLLAEAEEEAGESDDEDSGGEIDDVDEVRGSRSLKDGSIPCWAPK